MLRTHVLPSEALLAHDVDVCLERPSGALPSEWESVNLGVSELCAQLAEALEKKGSKDISRLFEKYLYGKKSKDSACVLGFRGLGLGLGSRVEGLRVPRRALI